MEVVIEVVVQVVIGRTVELVRVDFFVFLGQDCLGKMMGTKVVIEVVVEVVVLVW